MSASEREVAASGPFESVEWPSRLAAHVVEPGSDPAIHGYAVQGDLSVHYGYAETLYLTLTGELPEPEQARALEVVLTFCAPVGLNEAPAHAAALVNLCGASPRSVLSAAAITLAERGSEVVGRHGRLLSWLVEAQGELPAEARSEAAADRAQCERLARAVPPAYRSVLVEQPLSIDAALIAVLFASGLRRPEQIEAIWTIAGMAACFAEALLLPARAFRQYPMNLPPFDYQIQGETR